MVDIENWMGELAEKLTGRFGPRLLFLGLQGSYGRGEAGEDSDIDVAAVTGWSWPTWTPTGPLSGKCPRERRPAASFAGRGS